MTRGRTQYFGFFVFPAQKDMSRMLNSIHPFVTPAFKVMADNAKRFQNNKQQEPTSVHEEDMSVALDVATRGEEMKFLLSRFCSLLV